MRLRSFQAKPVQHELLSAFRNPRHFLLASLFRKRLIHDQNGPRRLSDFWVPTGGIAQSTNEDSHELLIRAGFVRQAHAGIFQLLPLGLRVQEKLERLIDKYMLRLGASKVSLSTLSSEELWSKSGRLDKGNQELFHLEDRKGMRFLLSPTHEEEITSLVGSVVRSHRDLPLRLYQISRKYRDELRPRQGLLRGREFLMKDLYTFDISRQDALATYQRARQAYDAIFTELKLPYLVAEADSGSIGGDLSHEYQLPHDYGEDLIIACNSCGHAANEELTGGQVIRSKNQLNPWHENSTHVEIGLWRGITYDRSTVVEVVYPVKMSWTDHLGNSQTRLLEVSTTKIKYLVPEIDLSMDLSSKDRLLTNDSGHNNMGADDVRETVRMNDWRVSKHPFEEAKIFSIPEALSSNINNGDTFDFIRAQSGDTCPRCFEGTIKVTRAIEIGHTFHLGTRYSKPFGLSITPEPSKPDCHPKKSSAAEEENIALQMGCHGIGISRMIAAVASTLADDKGLNWPSLMAPFQVVIVPRKGHEADADTVYRSLSIIERSAEESGPPTVDAIIDDRDKDFVWKLNDADLIGYPVMVILGRNWAKTRSCEVQCRRLKIKEDVNLDNLGARVSELLGRL